MEAERRENLRVQVRLDALVKAIVTDGDGRMRLEPERRAMVDAARAALDRLAEDQAFVSRPPPPDPRGETALAPHSDGSLGPDTILANTYAVRERIGRGGLAEIYRVRHRELRSDHAVKILRGDRALDPVVARLHLAEARALLLLDHDAIPSAREVLRHGDGRAFIVMDLLHGPTLAQTLGEEGAMQADELIVLTRRLAGALSAVHAAGLVHGDVSPENVMLRGGVAGATLIDFGAVRQAGEATPDLEFAGKWSSAAPEQLAGEPGGPAVDLYALGLLLVCAARGERLAMGSDRESARAARSAMCAPDLGGRIGALARDLLRPDPLRRPSAEEVVKRLDAGGLGGLVMRLKAKR